MLWWKKFFWLSVYFINNNVCIGDSFFMNADILPDKIEIFVDSHSCGGMGVKANVDNAG